MRQGKGNFFYDAVVHYKPSFPFITTQWVIPQYLIATIPFIISIASTGFPTRIFHRIRLVLSLSFHFAQTRGEAGQTAAHSGTPCRDFDNRRVVSAWSSEKSRFLFVRQALIILPTQAGDLYRFYPSFYTILHIPIIYRDFIVLFYSFFPWPFFLSLFKSAPVGFS